jgi:hypothetical protein
MNKIASAVHPFKKQMLSRHRVVLIIFIFYLIGTHLRLSLYWGDSILLPMYPMLISAALLLLIFAKPFFRITKFHLLIFLIFTLTQPLLTLAPESFSFNTLKASLQLLASIVSALILIYALSTVDQGKLRALLIFLLTFVSLLALLENIGFRDIFNQIRDFIYSSGSRAVYAADHRDLEIYGRIRTTAFASEPSYLADTFAALIIMIFFLDPKRGSIGSWVSLLTMMFFVYIFFPSFKYIFYLASVCVWMFWPRNRSRAVIFLVCLLISGLLIFLFSGLIADYLQLFTFSYFETGSFFGRILVGPIVGMNALSNYPIYGYGLGNEHGLESIVFNAWNDSGAFLLFPWYADWRTVDLMSNGFWWYWSYLGIGGGIIFATIIMRLLKQINVEKPLRTLVSVWIVWYAGAAFVDPMSWYMLIVFSVGAVSYHAPLTRDSRSLTKAVAVE